MFPLNNFLVRQLRLNGQTLTASGEYLYLEGEPLVTSALSVLLTGDQYVSGLKEFEEANINSGIIKVKGLDTEIRVLKDGVGQVKVNWEDNVLLFNELASLDWGDRVLRSGNSVPELGISLDWNNRILSGRWKTVYPEEQGDIATKGYVDDKVTEVVGNGFLRLVAQLPSGVDSVYIAHSDLNGTTTVAGNIQSNAGGAFYLHQISGKTPSGFYLLLSDDTDSSDYYFDCTVSRTS